MKTFLSIPTWRRGIGGLILILISLLDASAQRAIVTIGDSNGANEYGWVNQLKSIRKQDSIFNYSISGNTIGFDNLGNEKLNTLKNAIANLEDAATKSVTGMIDDVVILLGTNDCKKVFADSNNQVVQNLEKLIQLIKEQKAIIDSESEIYIVTPPPFGADSILKEKYKGGDKRVRKLLPGFMNVSLKYDCHFIDVYHELKPQFDKLNRDGVHLNADGSMIIANAVSRFLDSNEKIPWDDEQAKSWPIEFSEVEIKSPLDEVLQKAYFYKTKKSNPQPLIISLHTWSGDYTQEDPLVQQILERDWNYIHPDFRGMNNTPKSCGSKYVIDDIDQAISFALNNCNVDMQNIHVIGVSGGGMATLLSYMNSNYPVLSFSAWVPISDLAAWYYQSLGRKNKYAGHILTATGSIDSVLNVEEARNRSPLFMVAPTDKRKGSRLTIYAGIHDGYEGSVPVSQSLNFYNKVIKDNGASDDQLISENEILKLVSMRMYPTLTDKKIGDRNVIYERNFKNISLILFEGRHEMLTDVALELLQID